jgi:hypothetical protein
MSSKFVGLVQSAPRLVPTTVNRDWGVIGQLEYLEICTLPRKKITLPGVLNGFTFTVSLRAVSLKRVLVG